MLIGPAGRQVVFSFVRDRAYGFRRLMQAIEERDRWYVALIWLGVCAFAADWAICTLWSVLFWLAQ